MFSRRIFILFGLAFMMHACSEIPSAQRKNVAQDSYIDLTPKSVNIVADMPGDDSIDMLNLVRFKDFATYPEDSPYADKNWTGAEAYNFYTQQAGSIVSRIDASFVYYGLPKKTLIGPENEAWDVAIIVGYKKKSDFGKLLADPDYKKIAFHRSAAVADSRLILLTQSSAE